MIISRKAIILALVAFVLSFASGFALRPVISPPQQATTAATTPSATSVSSEPSGTQYFMAHIDDARQVVASCRNGSVRGGECATAEEAIIKVDAAERRKQFLGN